MTVIELVFTISILGVMFFFALKGQATIESMRSIAVSYQLRNFQQAVQGYEVNYKALPGDDTAAADRWQRPLAMTFIAKGMPASLNGNSTLDGQFFDSSNPTGEQFAAWRDLRYGGFVEGDASLQGLAALPETPFGGFYGFDEGNLGQKSASLCASKVPGRAAQLIDQRIDDGKINAGKMVATSKFSIEDNNHFDAPDTAPYNVEKEYIICVPALP